MRRIALTLSALFVLATPATAVTATYAKSHRRPKIHHARRHARVAGVEREYWPIFEEWLTPLEGREVEADVTAQLDALAEPEG